MKSDDGLPADLDAALREVVAARMESRRCSRNALAAAIGRNSVTVWRKLDGKGLFSVQEWSDIAVALGDDLEGLLEEARQLLRQTGE